mmetsp:Transcript_2166/g.5823  ORF Transcript_2166/g.5823 Transcript_2166/m.5823 type:complete len:206 (-) Transcript_2166:22-639(-)
MRLPPGSSTASATSRPTSHSAMLFQWSRELIPDVFGAMSLSTTSAADPGPRAARIRSMASAAVRSILSTVTQSSGSIGSKSAATTRPPRPMRVTAIWHQLPGLAPRSTTVMCGWKRRSSRSISSSLSAARLRRPRLRASITAGSAACRLSQSLLEPPCRPRLGTRTAHRCTALNVAEALHLCIGTYSARMRLASPAWLHEVGFTQ